MMVYKESKIISILVLILAVQISYEADGSNETNITLKEKCGKHV